MTDITAWLDPEWMRALHIISVIALMAGLLMLPRLYAYQTGAEAGGELEKKMIEASSKLRTIIVNPALILTWVFGIAILATSNWIQLQMAWMHVKLTLVVILSALHGYYSVEGKRLAKGERRRSEKFWRMMNEVPFLIAIAVVILAVVEPF
ncbi:MAG: CopD family protein [Hyphomonadaceae bacterium]|nr:MAG: membrane protein [Caulobacteraceae bacterium]MBT9444525.1 CopD family protein [Hyphomonadaceae bacterium]TPW07812.1 MAG: membrane protein [Alphaproteobacteria bacterium]